MKILLGYLNKQLGRVVISILTVGNTSLHEDTNDNGVRVENMPHKNARSC
jgi:hypothetical protein